MVDWAQNTNKHFTARDRNSRGLGDVYKRQVPTGPPSRGGDVAVCVFDINQPSLPTPFYSVLVFISVLMALSLIHI